MNTSYSPSVVFGKPRLSEKLRYWLIEKIAGKSMSVLIGVHINYGGAAVYADRPFLYSKAVSLHGFEVAVEHIADDGKVTRLP